jgi:hypothetical protein
VRFLKATEKQLVGISPHPPALSHKERGKPGGVVFRPPISFDREP